jgi:acyl-CoA hydrolase
MDMATALKLDDSFDWRALLGKKLVSAEEAISHVKSGDRVTMSISHATPFTLCAALAAQHFGLNHNSSRSAEIKPAAYTVQTWQADLLNDLSMRQKLRAKDRFCFGTAKSSALL